jgi:transposase
MHSRQPNTSTFSPYGTRSDAAYDTNELMEWLKCLGIKAIIPPKSNRKEEIECDYWHYKERHAVECMFGKLKHYRIIATQYDKKAINYMRMLSFMAEIKRQQILIHKSCCKLSGV